ncbi:CRISPR-associated helicase Cas3' [Sphingomonas carotinifaciens]|uniref:CRISPR-associated endonuclease/helicase Cas3 n=1 Tax=Sphingomonas carotinifaciens TaxID=1166323 RepID=A0A1G7R471_9SPHN|nr:CRISPR-associated helicase Cas3' [Sphingomonas carotinifaciens]MBB4087909.1 CRISPR-associated endonuclease/helicase Cas3 [Sphingomonas carotinifaciens]MWC44762.1 CRISPR-associated helicase Cas3' [Sphingomonas carotinifaciens]SDG04919.1 CRISPR-associated endonuclease/helicase Cas3 [Sphingomonas carotinifaciens]
MMTATGVNGPWAKLTRNADGTVAASLPLIDHCLDVGTAAQALLSGGAWSLWLSTAAGRPLTAQDHARLIVLAALHDLGKANRGFQARIDPHAPLIGHTGQVAALLFHSRLKTGAAATMLRHLVGAWGAHQHFAAALAHHGRPLPELRRGANLDSGSWMKHSVHWMPVGDDDPGAHVVALIDAVRARWPLAWETGEPLPDAPRFVSLFAGLVTLADWLGSDTRRFPVAGPYGRAREALREEQARDMVAARGLVPLPTPEGDFHAAVGRTPHGFQQEAAADDLGRVALIEAETGSGKTEAALWRWLELRRRGEVDGLYFALPTRAAAVQLQKRVNDVLKRVWGEGAPEAVLAVPGYLVAGDTQGQELPGYEVRWDDGEPGGTDDHRWAAERAKNFLAARVAVGTIDQALLGVLPVKHALFRAGALARSLLVVDEVHASDTYMSTLLERLLDNHLAVGGQALLLSATLGAEARARLLKTPLPPLAEAQALPYPALSGRDAPLRAAIPAARSAKHVAIETDGLIGDPDAIAARAVAAARTGASVLVIRNTVAGAVQVAQAVAARAPDLAFRLGDVPTVHHGRFAPGDRRLLDAAVETAFGKGRAARGQVLVGTQTLEQSLDIDADFLITDLAPMDVLLQRIGRLHRHMRDDRGAHAQARALILRPATRDLMAASGPRHGLGGVYPDILQLESTLRLLESRAHVTIPDDNRHLVETALHPGSITTLAATLGTAWTNHAANRSASFHAARRTAEQLALDLSMDFNLLEFTSNTEDATTRLGAATIQLPLPRPLPGPFGQPVPHLTLPPHMLPPTKTPQEVRILDDCHFQLGTSRYAYDSWGLRNAN